MSKTVAMRSTKDRLRYTISFELTLMMMLIPAGAFFFDEGFDTIGILGVMLSLKAMVVNVIYNRIFDHFDARAGRVSSDRSHFGRLAHAIGFEVSLTLSSLPIYGWWLGMTILEALATDIVVTSFVVIYTYFFTWGYDRMYPVRSAQPRSGCSP
ncbi:MAG: PACE efflux transporter [Pikeienuella sp.]